MEISSVQRDEVGRPLGPIVPAQLMGAVNHGLLILLVAIITLPNERLAAGINPSMKI
jgi:hypothetical protein